ncbi:MAG: DUF3159 domain-containing protein [Solirubrobacterales bacterium]|nr:DUF3159 domain-containing protein [Solirubrobacterales bacterium]HMT06004.1 DUF3159 domain-containing protein [Solirubrobacterales bacterium]
MTDAPRPPEHIEVELDEKQEINLLDELGGPQGIADSSIPGLAFVIAYTVTGQKLELAAGIAVGIALLIALVRLVRGERARYAASGFLGVALAAFIATRTGKAEDFFLPGLLLNAGYALAYAVSIAVRWPLMGVFIGPLIGEGMTWRKDPGRVRMFSRISWLWVGTFLLRLTVQLPLYLTGSLVALGIAKTAMGLPIFALAIWLSYLMLRASGIDLKQKPEPETEPG